MRERQGRGWVLAALGAFAVAALVGCSSDGSEGADASTTTEQSSGSDDDGTVTQAEAEEAALEEVGEGEVTWSGAEDDRGAAWEVEVTMPSGLEIDVLVAADGSIVKQVPRLGEGPVIEGPGVTPEGGAISQEDAEAAALEAVGEGEVTWSGPEDDRGAAWEIEVTRTDGSEIDVLVAPDGSIVN